MTTFKQLGIAKDYDKSLNEMGIVNPTQIQQEAIPLLLSGRMDLVAQAHTGTGKTAAYGLPLLHQISPSNKSIQGLVLCPTRELGQQVAKQLFKYTKYAENKVFTEAVYGGAPIDKQISALKRPTQILVATPGRLVDLLKRKAVDLSNVFTVVLDEADEMLSLGFKKELEQILTHLQEVQNKWLFSATMPDGIRQIIKKFIHASASRITVNPKATVNKNIDHQFIICEEADKSEILFRLLKYQKEERGIIFCKTKNATVKLSKQLQAKNYKVDCIQGDMLQKERDKVMRAFKNESLQFLVATDLAARGIDVPDLAFVIHYQLPDKEEYYTHRSGRTARAGKTGVSMALVTSKELKSLRYFEKALGIGFHQIRQKGS